MAEPLAPASILWQLRKCDPSIPNMASIRVPSRRTGTGGGGCRAAVKYVLLATAAAWCGYFAAVARHSKDETVDLSALRRPGAPADSTRRLRENYPLIHSLAQELEVTVMANSLTQALTAAMEASRPFPFERISLLHHTMLLTGHPPLVSRSDASVDGLPDFTSFGLPPTIPHPQFMVVDPWVGLDGSSEQTTGNTRQITDNPFRYVVKNACVGGPPAGCFQGWRGLPRITCHLALCMHRIVANRGAPAV